MNRQKLTLQVMKIMLIMLPLVGCGAPAATPTLIPSTPTLIPPTDIPVPPTPTLTEAPRPTVTPLPFIEGTQFPMGRFVDEDRHRAFEFDGDGTWRYYEGNMEKPAVSGKFATNGNLYTEMTHNYPLSKSIPVTYYWFYDGERLTFQLYGEDLINHRRTCYDGQTYTRSE